MSTPRRSAVALSLAISAALGLSACSGSDDKPTPTAKDAWSKAQDTMATYKTLEIKGEGKTDGKASSLTMRGNVKGQPISVDGSLGGAKVQIVAIDGKTYVKADKTFWTDVSQLPASAAAPFANQWIVQKSKGSSSFDGAFTDAVKEVTDDSSDANKKLLSDKATVTSDKVGDTDAWKLESADKSVRAWVSKDDSHDVLKSEGLSADSKKDLQTTTYLSHDKDYGIKAPSGAKNPEDLVK